MMLLDYMRCHKLNNGQEEEFGSYRRKGKHSFLCRQPSYSTYKVKRSLQLLSSDPFTCKFL